MKKKIAVLLTLLMLVFCFAACTSELPEVSSEVDFETSKYKHINNGGIEADNGLPYNIDAITGATLTVEGPAVVSSTPLSIREVENLKSGIVRGQYKDKSGTFTYEGLDLYYLLYNMSSGDNGIILTDTAYKVVLKNANREDVATLSLADITAAHEAGRPAILAYGIGTKDESTVAPFVFDGVDEGTHSLGYVSQLKNDDGCIKLVYDNSSYGDGQYKEFSNVAYVYVCEENEPGFKHSDTSEDSFGASRYTDYIITLRGSAIGHEYDLTVADLEKLVTYNADGTVVSGGMGYSDWYSLANNAYWYVNEYEGLKLYELLQYLGMPDAETMGRKLSRTTLVSFIASDGVASSEVFSVETLSYPDGFGYYKKNAQDSGDGTYVPSNADLVKTGYPILLSYGVNNYPYTIAKTDDDYVSGLSNSGGPLRVVFGKTQYNHPNGSNQVQYLSEIIAGTDVLYNTHKYTDNEAQNAYAGSTISVTVKNTDRSTLIDKTLSVGEIEDIIYGENVSAQDKKSAKVKEHYEVSGSSDIYEGVDMEYFLMNYLGIPGMNGTIVIKGEGQSITLSLEEIFAEGYNNVLNRDGIPAILAFAKNGTPLVEKTSAGYVESIALNPYLDSDPASYDVDNQGGPLAILIPCTDAEASDAKAVFNIESIEVSLIPDSYAHIDKSVSSYQSQSVYFYGEGLEKSAYITVGEIEGMQTKVKTLDYSMLNKSGVLSQARYRGISIYELFKQIGINNNAGDVTITCQDGTQYTYSLLLLKKSYENFADPDKESVYAMLVYGEGDIDGDRMNGTPLTSETGGPLMLVVPMESADSVNKNLRAKSVKSVYVSANEVQTWSHSMSDVFSEFLDYQFTLSFKNEDHQTDFNFTVKDIEEMTDIIVNDKYTVLDIGTCEGIDIWKLIKKYAAQLNIDPTSAISINALAEDGYSNDLLANCFLSSFTDGVESETGDRKTIILAYAVNGYPLVDTEGHEGYTGTAKNCDGPLRVVVEGFQGGSIKYCNKITVTVPGSGELK